MASLLGRAVLAVDGSIELSLILKATVVLALALFAARLARGTRASVRHTLLASAFGVLLALPVAMVLLPRVTVGVRVADVKALAPPSVTVGESELLGGTLGAPASSGGSRWAFMSVSTLLRAGWAAGATVFLIPLAGALWRLQRIRQTGLPWLKGQTLARGLAIDAGVNRPVDVLLHEDIAAPMTCGVVRPLIVLPTDAPKWVDADVQRAIVHELEHVHRADWPVHLLARVVCSVYWFHPLVWTAWGGLCLESEQACDDAVLRRWDRSAYAEQLVSLARRLVRRDARALLSMASRTDLSARVAAVLDVHQVRGRTSTLHVTLIVGVAFVLVLGLSPLNAVDQGAPTQTSLQSSAIPPGPVAFEVASVKPNNSGDPGMAMQARPGRFTATNVTLRLLIRTAYRVQDLQISGGPSWLDSDRFDIVAKAAGNPSQEQLQNMLRALLVDRFRLAMHLESTQRDTYALVVDRRDGRLGSQLTRRDCVTLPPAPSTSSARGPLECNVIQTGFGRLNFRGAPMAQIATGLSPYVGRVVLDQTGLGGNYDVDLRWTPEQTPPADGQARPNDGPIGDEGPSIFTALREQLGLELESTRGPVDVLVIDRVERPTPD